MMSNTQNETCKLSRWYPEHISSINGNTNSIQTVFVIHLNMSVEFTKYLWNAQTGFVAQIRMKPTDISTYADLHNVIREYLQKYQKHPLDNFRIPWYHTWINHKTNLGKNVVLRFTEEYIHIFKATDLHCAWTLHDHIMTVFMTLSWLYNTSLILNRDIFL